MQFKSSATLLILAIGLASSAILPKEEKSKAFLAPDSGNVLMEMKPENLLKLSPYNLQNEAELPVFSNKLTKPALTNVTLISQLNGVNYAVDVLSYTSTSSFSCIRSNGYKVAFTRLYRPNNNGQGDFTGIQNSINAYSAKLKLEFFVTPSTTFVKSGSTQCTEALNYAISNNIILTRVWLQVTSPLNWSTDINGNINLIKSFINTAKQNNIAVGIYTNWYDWAQITGSVSTISSYYGLWYWNVNGVGVAGETSQNFNDFVNFGPFSTPIIKQYGIGEYGCNCYVNTNMYYTNADESENSIKLPVEQKSASN